MSRHLIVAPLLQNLQASELDFCVCGVLASWLLGRRESMWERSGGAPDMALLKAFWSAQRGLPLAASGLVDGKEQEKHIAHRILPPSRVVEDTPCDCVHILQHKIQHNVAGKGGK